MESYIVDSLAKWHYVPELSQGTNQTQWSNKVYQSTTLPPARVEKYLNAIGWVYRRKNRGHNISKKSSYTMYGLGYRRKRYKN